MKKMFLVFSLISGSAFAGQSALQCKEVGTGPDNGYSVYVSKNRKRSIVEEVTLAGAKTLATLNCAKTNEQPSHPDAIYTVLTCSEPNIRDGGYSLQVKQGGFAGLTTATLSEITIAGANPIAELACQAVE